jgi:hypothetical protein
MDDAPSGQLMVLAAKALRDHLARLVYLLLSNYGVLVGHSISCIADFTF